MYRLMGRHDTSDLQRAFGDRWVGPGDLEHAKAALLAKYPATADDGVDVEVWGSAWPATFFQIHVKGVKVLGFSSGGPERPIATAKQLASAELAVYIGDRVVAGA
jgi:hypothetical protein